MNCRTCREPIERCPYDAIHARTYCRGWRHSADGWHVCLGSETTGRHTAEPEPGTPGLAETPTAPPAGQVV